MKKGILIYAIGHGNYYRMAEALAASLRCNGTKEAGISIGIICDSVHNITYPDLFDDTIILNREDFIVDGKVVFNNATVKIYDLSPYDVTIKLDADMIWMVNKPVIDLFNSLKKVALSFSNRGHGWGKGNSVWADEKEIQKAYRLTESDKLYKIYGEFLYFKKSVSLGKYFEKVNEIYKNPKVKCAEFSNGSMTDELAFQIACMLTGIYPHADNFTPVYNSFLGYHDLKYKYPYQLPDEFYGYSIGGNVTNTWTKTSYDTLAQHYFNTIGLAAPYQVSNKKSFLPERKNL